MVRRVREVLRLQTERVSPLIRLAAFAGNGAVKKIAGVKLDSRLIG